MSKEKLDVKGKMCPLPVALTKRRLANMTAGQILEVTGEGDLEFENIQRWLKNNGQDVVEATSSGADFKIVIKKH
jgi:tRNA 2-thiouridine synthesizing protein A